MVRKRIIANLRTHLIKVVLLILKLSLYAGSEISY